VLAENVEIGVVQFTRHEPTLNPRLIEWVGWAKELDYHSICLITNGRRLSQAGFAHRLAEAGVNSFELSLHGHTAELHDRITQKKGSFEQATAGIEVLVKLRSEMQLGFKLHSTVIAQNVPYLPQMVEKFLQWDPDSYGLNAVFLTGQAAQNADKIAVRYSDMIESFERCIDREEFVPVTISEIPPCLTVGRLPRRYIGFREEFHHVRTGEKGVPSHLVAQASTRGFNYSDSCQACLLSSLCDGVAEEYINRFGWDEFEPLTDSAIVEESFATIAEESELKTIFAAPGDQWQVSCIERTDESALLQVKSTHDPDRVAKLWVTPRDENERVFRRTRKFNVALRGEGYSQEECDLAEEVVATVEKHEVEHDS